MSSESAKSAYENLGVSATKKEVHAAVQNSDPGLFPGAFCRVGVDALGRDPAWCCALHADDAGTKALVAYLMYRETGDASVFRRTAQDALVMNLDDLLCIGAYDRFLLSNTINRNSRLVGGDAIREVIAGYEDFLKRMEPLGINIVPTGGETADMGDSVRTIIIGANLATRMRREEVVDNRRIAAGDVIVGMQSFGRASYEDAPNSGIGDNGLTLARHALLTKAYLDKYPETVAPETDRAIAYRGPFRLEDQPNSLGMTIGDALTSPTRTYAPVIKKVLETHKRDVHGIVHNTGGGQTKCIGFGQGIRFVKHNLFDPPALFHLIAEHGKVPWREMYQTFNMGHRMELFVPKSIADSIIKISRSFDIDARVVGKCEAADKNAVHLQTSFGDFDY